MNTLVELNSFIHTARSSTEERKLHLSSWCPRDSMLYSTPYLLNELRPSQMLICCSRQNNDCTQNLSLYLVRNKLTDQYFASIQDFRSKYHAATTANNNRGMSAVSGVCVSQGRSTFGCLPYLASLSARPAYLATCLSQRNSDATLSLTSPLDSVCTMARWV